MLYSNILNLNLKFKKFLKSGLKNKMKNKSGLIFKLNETYNLNEVSVQFKLNEVNVQFTYTAKQPASPYTCLNGIFLYLPS